MSEASFLDTLGDINLNPFKLLGFGTGQSNTQSQNGGGSQSGGGFGGTQSGGGIIGGGSQNGGGGSREDRKRAIRDDQSVTDYGNMLNRASGIRAARLAKIDARREFLKTPEGQAELKQQRDAENDRQREANSPEGRQARVNRTRELAKSAEDMKTANAAEKSVIDNDPIIQKQRREADARTAARWDADHAGREDKPYVNPNSPEGRIAAQNAAEYASGSGPGRAVDDQRDQFGPKNIETARADAKKDTARVKAELEAERTADGIAGNNFIADRDNKNRRDTGAIPYLTPQDTRPVYPPIKDSDKEDGNGVHLFLAKPQPEPKYPNPLVRKPNGDVGPVSPSAPRMQSTREDNPFPPPLDAEARDNFADMKKKLNPSLYPNPLVRKPDGFVGPVSPSAPGMQSGRPQFVGPEDKPTNTNVASLLRPKTSPKTSGPQDKPDYGVPPGIARPYGQPSGIPPLIAIPQPEPPDNTPIDAQGQKNLQNIKRAFNPNTRPSPNERPSPNAGDQPFLGKPSSGLTRLANIPIQVKPGERARISASQLAREAQSRRA